ncbi:MAG TPA: PLP-dependent aminotransferase family protein [Candidatus Obscuribacterales bacterium]
MAKLLVKLERDGRIPLHRQLYEEIRQLILSGELKANTKLPSTRVLSEELNVSRPTASAAYKQLLDEGYLQTFSGFGTFVSANLPDASLLESNRQQSVQPGKAAKQSLSSCGSYFHNKNPIDYEQKELWIDFRDGSPALDRFPLRLWRKLMMESYSTSALSALEYPADPRGYLPLRQALANYLRRVRSVVCGEEQIIIVAGSQQALNLVARVHVDIGDAVALEEPGFPGAREIFASYGAYLKPIPVDEEGLITESLLKFDRAPKVLYLTPSHQYPLGSVLSLPRRIDITNWGKAKGAVIVEDDYDGEFRYEGRPLPALQSLNNQCQVVYIGTFSKVLFPSLRIGYMVVPDHLVDVYSWAKRTADHSSPVVEQMALAEFILGGAFERHIRQMRTLYNHRRQSLVQSLKAQFGEGVTILGENTGMHFTARIRHQGDVESLPEKLLVRGVRLPSTRLNYLAGQYPGGEFIFNYANNGEKKSAAAVMLMARLLAKTDEVH